MSVNFDVAALLKMVTWGHVVAAYATIKVGFAAWRAKAAQKAAQVEAAAYAAAHQAEASAKGAVVQVKSFVSYLLSEIKAAL